MYSDFTLISSNLLIYTFYYFHIILISQIQKCTNNNFDIYISNNDEGVPGQ